MLNTKIVTKKLNDLPQIKQMMKSLFPLREQAPMWFLLNRAKKDFVDFFAFFDEGKFVGFTYLVTHNNRSTIKIFITKKP